MNFLGSIRKSILKMHVLEEFILHLLLKFSENATNINDMLVFRNCWNYRFSACFCIGMVSFQHTNKHDRFVPCTVQFWINRSFGQKIKSFFQNHKSYVGTIWKFFDFLSIQPLFAFESNLVNWSFIHFLGVDCWNIQSNPSKIVV